MKIVWFSCNNRNPSSAFEQDSNSTFSTIERQALSDLYASTDGDSWNWWQLTDTVTWNFSSLTVNPCTENWQGINCTYIETISEYHVTSIILSKHNLHGSLPNSIGEFSYLQHLQLDSNIVSGFLPATIGNLSRLISINSVSYTHLTLPTICSV